jgi:hypothetical protein
VCVSHMPRSEFFKLAPRFFRNRSIAVIKCLRDEDALVPVIQVVVAGVELDILYAQLPASTPINTSRRWTASNIPAHALSKMDSKSLRSLQGALDTAALCQLIPTTKMDTFRTFVGAVKHWAKQRGLYSNKSLCLSFTHTHTHTHTHTNTHTRFLTPGSVSWAAIAGCFSHSMSCKRRQKHLPPRTCSCISFASSPTGTFYLLRFPFPATHLGASQGLGGGPCGYL